MEIDETVHPAWIEIDAGALADNLREIRRRAGADVEVMASIKADAYGHGAVGIARVLAGLGVGAFMTGRFEEAVAIRGAGIDTKIIIFGSNLPGGVRQLMDHDLIPTVYDAAGAEAVSQAARKPTPVYVKVDSGLGRLGVPLDEAAAFIARVAERPNVVVEGVYTHLPFFDSAGRDWAARQLAAFDGLLDRLAAMGLAIAVTQARASAHLLTGLTDRCNAVCAGHVLYGLSPVSPEVSDLAGFRPVLRAIKARIIHVAHHAAGNDVAIAGSYGLKNARVSAVLPVGMTDGMRAPVEGQTACVLVRGRRVPILNVSLEHTTVDVGNEETPQIGEEAVIVGSDGEERITLEDVAGWLGRTPLEVMTTFSRHLPVRFVGQA